MRSQVYMKRDLEQLEGVLSIDVVFPAEVSPGKMRLELSRKSMIRYDESLETTNGKGKALLLTRQKEGGFGCDPSRIVEFKGGKPRVKYYENCF